MQLSGISSVLSRFFVLGFFLPGFFGLTAIAYLARFSILPDLDGDHATRAMLIIGGIALLAGLVLITFWSTFLGSVFGTAPRRRALLPLLLPPLRWQLARFERLTALMENDSDKVRTRAAWQRSLRFPSAAARVVPTRLGNAVRGTQDYVYDRWGLDLTAVWTPVETMLAEQEANRLADDQSNQAFALHATLWTLIAGATIIVDRFVDDGLSGFWLALLTLVISTAIAYALYRLTVEATIQVGSDQKALVARHRYELYDQLGVKRPATLADERHRLGPQLNLFLLYGIPIDDDLTAATQERQSTFADFARDLFGHRDLETEGAK